jgi:predicted PurR-regulated permease PerM
VGLGDLFGSGRGRRVARTGPRAAVRAAAEPTVVLVREPAAESGIPQGVRTSAAWAWRALVIAAAIVGLGWVLGHFSQVTIPLAIGVLLAALLAPLAERLRAWNWPPMLAAAACLIGIIVVIGAIISGVGVTAVRQAPDLVDQSIQGFQQSLAWLAGDPWRIDQAQIDTWLASVTTWINDSRSLLAGYAARIGASVGHFFAGIAIALIATFFFLADGGHMWRGTVSLLPAAYQEPTAKAAARGWNSLVSYMRAQVLVSAVDAAGVAIIAAIIGVPMALALFALTFIVCFIPVVGAIIAGTVATLLALVTHGPGAALIMLGGTIAVMWLESHLLQPLLLGKAASLHPLAVLLGIVVGAELGGITGALLAVPIMAFGVAFVRSVREGPIAGTVKGNH